MKTKIVVPPMHKNAINVPMLNLYLIDSLDGNMEVYIS